RLLALLVALLGLAGILEYAFNLNLGIDQLFFVDRASDGILRPGQMAPITAINFLLTGLAFLLLDSTVVIGRHRLQPAQFLALAINTAASIALLDYVLHSNTPSAHTPRSTLTQFALSIGLVCARTTGGVGALIVSRSLGGDLTRRLWPATVAV